MKKQFKQNYLVDHLNEDYNMGFNHCKEAVLKILNEPLQNLDLSEDYCDSRWIGKIKKL
jgi:hypothetical protein